MAENPGGKKHGATQNNDGLADFILTDYSGCRYVTFYERNSNHILISRHGITNSMALALTRMHAG